MNSSSDISNPTADERASYWAARLDGSVLSAPDQLALEAWLAEDPVHRTLLSHYCQFSADLELLLPVLVESGAVDRPQELTLQRRAWNFKWMAAAAFVAVALVAAGLWLSRPGMQAASLATAAAQRQTLTLADGTRAELNAQTSLQIEIGPVERRVRLAGGEAFFTVTKDKNRPFIVETPAGSVRVTGTVFNVRTESTAALEVVVVEGSVQVRPGEAATGRPVEPVMLAPRDKLSAGVDGVTVQKLSAGALDDILAWRRGQIVFEGAPLSAVLARFARYHGRGITAAPEVANLRVGGRYSLDDLDAFLGALETVLPVRATRGLSGTIQVGPVEKPVAAPANHSQP
jgi:transmembrane sensor